MNQDFELYAQTHNMDGIVAEDYKSFFFDKIDYKNHQFKVLDFGCGDGKFYEFFRKFFKDENIYGIEISKTRVDRCKHNGWKKVYLIEKLGKLPFKNDYFDFINFQQVIEHIPDNEINFYLDELSRVLKTSGKIIITTPNYPIKRVYDLMNAIMLRDINKIYDDPTHITHYNFQNLEKITKNYFDYVKFNPTGGLFYNIFKSNFFSHKIIGICIK